MLVAICDDSNIHLTKIRSHLDKCCKEHSIEYQCFAFTSGLHLLQENIEQYDVVFLDVNMPGLDGIETARKLRQSNDHIIIVFVTAFIEYAPSGYEVEAFRYLLKEQLEFAFDRCMDNIVESLSSLKKRVFFKFVEGDVSLDIHDILYIESDKHKLSFHVAKCDEPYTIYQKLDEVEKAIGHTAFLRIHKSYLINMEHVDIIKRYDVTMKNGVQLPIPKNKYPTILKKYILYRG